LLFFFCFLSGRGFYLPWCFSSFLLFFSFYFLFFFSNELSVSEINRPFRTDMLVEK
jgi:hypothetical protein